MLPNNNVSKQHFRLKWFQYVFNAVLVFILKVLRKFDESQILLNDCAQHVSKYEWI